MFGQLPVNQEDADNAHAPCCPCGNGSIEGLGDSVSASWPESSSHGRFCEKAFLAL